MFLVVSGSIGLSAAMSKNHCLALLVLLILNMNSLDI